MNLTHCPGCRRLCFVNSAVCLGCAVSFRPGVLHAAASAEERAFGRRSGLMFLVPFVGALAALVVVLVRT